MAKILIVDDDPDLVESIERLLKSKKHEVIAAYDGDAGLEKVRSEKPDAIILDVMMPGKDGYAVCKELKSDPDCSSIPVLLLTAVVSHIPTTAYSMRDGMEIEAEDYIDKPVEPDELVNRVEELLA